MSFTFVSLDGFFAGPGGDLSWHHHDREDNRHAVESLEAGGTLLFGRKTYEMMAGYWPSPMALQNDPVVARGMNEATKLVFSRKLTRVGWENSTLVKGDPVEAMRRLKRTRGKDLAILGSGSIVRLFLQHGLLDQLQLLVDPVLLGKGLPLFRGLEGPLNLKLTDSKKFKSGSMLLTYAPTVPTARRAPTR